MRAVILSVGLVGALFVFSSAYSTVQAHSLGSSFEILEGKYRIDIGYEPDTFRAGRYVRLDFDLWLEADRDSVPYDHVWVRMLHNEQTVLATGIKRQDIGPTTLLFTFAEGGEYTLEASYRKGDNTIATTTIPLIVEKKDKGFFRAYGSILGAFVLGLLIGILSTALWHRRAS